MTSNRNGRARELIPDPAAQEAIAEIVRLRKRAARR